MRSQGRRGVAIVGALVLLMAATGPGCDGAREAGLGIALNWKPEPEFGGIFEALRAGSFAAHGLDVATTGGPGAPVIQMVSAGQVAYGTASADEVVMARDRGTDVVAIFATYQTSPQGLMAHAERGFESLAELLHAPGLLAVEPGLSYVKFLEREIGFGARKVVPYSYSIAPFLGDPSLAQQVFITSEPIAARRAGANPRVFLVADSGYNPYTAVVITQGERLRRHRAEVAAVVDALREGWRNYLDDPSPANAVMAHQNAEMDLETFALAAEAQAPLIETDETRRRGLGAMSAERWRILAEQLEALGLIGRAAAPEDYFAP